MEICIKLIFLLIPCISGIWMIYLSTKKSTAHMIMGWRKTLTLIFGISPFLTMWIIFFVLPDIAAFLVTVVVAFLYPCLSGIWLIYLSTGKSESGLLMGRKKVVTLILGVISILWCLIFGLLVYSLYLG